MNKEETLVEFLKGLHIAVNNSLAYSRQHPYFLKSTHEFKQKIEALFPFLTPIKVNISADSLFIDGKYWNKLPASVELSRLLHLRKIKGVEFRPGLTTEELADFLNFLSLQPKEIAKNGGLASILTKVNKEHLFLEELDYSGLLVGSGASKESKDLWLYIFKEAVESQDTQAMDELADGFMSAGSSLSVKDIVGDDKLNEDLSRFLQHLKDKDLEKFHRCSREISRLILKTGANANVDNPEKLKEILDNIEDNDLADSLWTSIVESNNTDDLTFKVFSQIAGQDKLEKAALSLREDQGKKDALRNDSALIKKIQSILTAPNIQNVSPTYHNALASLIQDISFMNNLFFDQEAMRGNYRMMMLNLLTQEGTLDGLNLILEGINKEWDGVLKDKDYKFLRLLFDAIKQKETQDLFPPSVFERAKENILQFVENNIWEGGQDSEDFNYLAAAIQKCSLKFDFYMDKIFKEDKLVPGGFKLFLKILPLVFVDKGSIKHGNDEEREEG